MVYYFSRNMLGLSSSAVPSPAQGAVVTKAVIRAAGALEVSNKALAKILGLSEASVSRMGTGSFELKPADKTFEVAILFLRLYRALDAIVGGDEAVARAWLKNPHTTLAGSPAVLIQSLSGLVNVVGYLDARRALV